jgi:DNA-binding transcriptional LysR family regulator
LLGLVQPHVSGLDSLVRLFETQRLHLQQRLLIASTPYLIAHHLPGPIHAYRTAYPNVRLMLRDDFHADSVLRLIDQGQLDLGVVPYQPDEPRHPHLDFEDLFDLEFTLLTPARHRLAQLKRVTPAELVKEPIIMGGGHNRTALENLLRRHHVLDSLQVVMESSSTDIIRKYVGMGLGIAVLYMGHEPDGPPKGLHLRPMLDAPRLSVALVLRKGAHQPEHVQKFCALARQCLGTRSKTPVGQA